MPHGVFGARAATTKDMVTPHVLCTDLQQQEAVLKTPEEEANTKCSPGYKDFLQEWMGLAGASIPGKAPLWKQDAFLSMLTRHY